jgi:hypothetical protein
MVRLLLTLAIAMNTGLAVKYAIRYQEAEPGGSAPISRLRRYKLMQLNYARGNT